MKASKEKWREKQEKRPRKEARWSGNPCYASFKTRQHFASKKGIEFTIKFEEMVYPDYCPVLGIKLEHGNGKPIDASPTIDRIDNSKGYVPGNVHVISYKANRMKSNATVGELKMLVAYFERLETSEVRV